MQTWIFQGSIIPEITVGKTISQDPENRSLAVRGPPWRSQIGPLRLLANQGPKKAAISKR